MIVAHGYLLALAHTHTHTHPICTTRTFFAYFFFVCPCDSLFLCVQVKSSLFDLTKMSFRSEPNPNIPFTPPATKKKSNHTQLLCCLCFPASFLLFPCTVRQWFFVSIVLCSFKYGERRRVIGPIAHLSIAPFLCFWPLVFLSFSTPSLVNCV